MAVLISLGPLNEFGRKENLKFIIIIVCVCVSQECLIVIILCLQNLAYFSKKKIAA